MTKFIKNSSSVIENSKEAIETINKIGDSVLFGFLFKKTLEDYNPNTYSLYLTLLKTTKRKFKNFLKREKTIKQGISYSDFISYLEDKNDAFFSSNKHIYIYHFLTTYGINYKDRDKVFQEIIKYLNENKIENSKIIKIEFDFTDLNNNLDPIINYKSIIDKYLDEINK